MTSHFSKSLLASLALVSLTGAAAQAAVYSVDALANSSSGGSPVATVALSGGQAFAVSADVSDLWSAGGLPRWSNADGLTGVTFATGSDESGEVAGTQIGDDFGLHTQSSFSAPYGSLVGEIGGTYILLGTNYAGSAPAGGGTLNLYYWDENNGDNSGSIRVTVDTRVSNVPEGGAGLIALGLTLFGAGLVRRTVSRTSMAR